MKNSLKNNVFLLGYIKNSSKFRIPLAILLSILDAIPPIMNVLIVKFVIDMSVSKRISQLIYFLLGVLIFYVIYISFGSWFRNKYCKHSDLKIEGYIQTILYHKASEVDLISYDDSEFYDSFTKALNETSSRAIGVLNTITRFISAIFTFLGIITVILLLDPVIILFTLVTVVMSVVLGNISNKCNYNCDMDTVPVSRKKDYIKRLFYMQQYIKDMRLFNLYDFFIAKYKKSNEQHRKVISKYENKQAFLEVLQAGIQIASVLGTIAFLAFRIIVGYISVGDFAGLLNSSQELSNCISNLFSIIPEIAKNSMYIENLKAFLNYTPKVEKQIGLRECNDDFHELQVKNLSFAYDNDNLVLKNINLSIKKGQKIAIVGYNGSGKSTLIKCILRLYAPTNGDILFNGVNYKDFNPVSLRKKFGIVFQDYQCFAISIADNILCRTYNEKYDKPIINNALDKSGLVNKVNSLPNGLQSILTKEFDNSGVILSGGQTQKLAIARAIAKDCDILIFDEPSSALDPLAEYELNKQIMELAKDKALIIVSHRLQTTKDADKILFLDSGEIIEEGTHQELMELSGKYAELYSIQAESYN